MSPRTGRPPKSGASRKKTFQLRISEEQHAELQQIAEALGISMAEVILKGISLVKAELKQ
ncbi:toxin-antitoxin system HicB family antitoxin [Holdemania massiliensis]|uniref:Toxin-antitoxin system HicB family antitoxin n=1 Tax=Holdemania massiliensis TaxID=1468449 RepID=A0A6N7S5X0_9FIRM|nr:toxin-antitoxin system HicB family antitoxin [Holdemania massiliensis]MSA70961.1 toxin-antitoxin system HicB family antitoxin [Holdemania massiliensis]MSA89287.1 toxin-antitoxin system HicB family antitoxin [Holdemania massiliensis]MSB78040.1 toxin-antitoxin system HicB family antitoxin [Holdemania massiliensis]MSC32965.1 toxin-antitoxin system HicB family antitoxin [Holdemania massiliensis]MSC39362.1 toxin-antitoxin system HicB family antitoxin [Holdemania massiliensis]